MRRMKMNGVLVLSLLIGLIQVGVVPVLAEEPVAQEMTVSGADINEPIEDTILPPEDIVLEPELGAVIQSYLTDAAVSTAKNVVNQAKTKNDYEKLVYYRNWICNNVNYDSSVDSNNVELQVNNVFDGNISTGCSCQGYANAFKYLCDLTSFNDSRIKCYVIWGKVDQGNGIFGHAWNMIQMDDGDIYFVDLTMRDTYSHPNKSEYDFFLGGVSGYIYSENGPSVENLVGFVFETAAGVKRCDYYYQSVEFNYHIREDLLVSQFTYQVTNSGKATSRLRGHVENMSITVSDQTYTGQSLKPAVIVKYRNIKLTEGEDYHCNYYDNVNPGTAHVDVIGKNGFSGSKTVYFKITASSNNNTNKDNKTNTTDYNDNQNNWDDVSDTSSSERMRNIQSFVSRMYTIALDREPDADGLKNWSNQLYDKKSDGASIARGFICSDEFKRFGDTDADYVMVLYYTFFNRPPDEDGWTTWMSSLNGGMSREEVLAGFVNSAEFGALCDSYGIARGTMESDGSNIYNSGVRDFVLRNYEKALGRPGETAGVEDWSHKINKGEMSALDVAQSFFHSQEFLNKNTSNDEYVEILYRTFLGREYDDAGKADWVGQLNAGKSRDDVMKGFAYSQEFKNIMAKYGL